MKLGITSRTFYDCIQNKEITEEDIIRFASKHGLQWVEIRDAGFTLNNDYLHRLRDISVKEGVRIHYAWDAGSLFDEDYSQTYTRGIGNASIFGPGTLSRTTIDTIRIRNTAGKLIYDQDEMRILSERLDEVIDMATDKHITIVFENAFESVKGFQKIMNQNKELAMTLDPSNFLNKDQANICAESKHIVRLYLDNKKKIPYIHIKSTHKNVMVNVLMEDGDFNWKTFLRMIPVKTWCCIELPSVNDLVTCIVNIKDAIQMVCGWINKS